MRLILFLLLGITSFISAFSQTKYQGKSVAVIAFEANPGFPELTFETSALNVKLQVEQANFQFNADILTFKNSNFKDSIQLSQLLPTERNATINFNGDLPAAIAFGSSSADQTFLLRGQLEINTFLQNQSLDLRIMTRDDEVAYSFSMGRTISNFNIILPDKFSKQLTGRIRITSTGGLLVLKY